MTEPYINSLVKVTDTDLGVSYNAFVADIEFYSQMYKDSGFDDSKDFTYILYTEEGLDSIENEELIEGSVTFEIIHQYTIKGIFDSLNILTTPLEDSLENLIDNE